MVDSFAFRMSTEYEENYYDTWKNICRNGVVCCALFATLSQLESFFSSRVNSLLSSCFTSTSSHFSFAFPFIHPVFKGFI